MTLDDWIQAIAIIVAVGASIVALCIASMDRKTQLKIAQRDRELSRLTVELDHAVRLNANRNLGGSRDDAERHRQGAEALALAMVVGARWVPEQYRRAMDYNSPDEAQAIFNDPKTAQWVKDKIEVGLAVQSILDAMYANSGGTEPSRLGKLRPRR